MRAGDSVETGALGVGRRRLAGRSVRPALRHLDAMCLGQQDTNELLREVRIDAGVDRPLATGGHHFADPGGLDDGRIAAFFEAGHFLAHGEPFGDDADQFMIQLVDASPERGQIGHRRGR